MSNKAKQEITDILKTSIDGSKIEAYRNIEYAAVRLAARERSKKTNAFFLGLVLSLVIVVIFETAVALFDPGFQVPVRRVAPADTGYFEPFIDHSQPEPISVDTGRQRKYDSISLNSKEKASK